MTFIPVLSAFGHQVIPLPTALLSSQTGGVKDYTYLPLSEESNKIIHNWAESGQSFDMLVTGYLPDKGSFDVANFCIDNLLSEGAKIIVDPVLGDNGELYQGFDRQQVNPMRALVKRADIIIPNYTEACILANLDYQAKPTIQELIKELRGLAKTIIVTGVTDKDKISTYADNGDGLLELNSPLIPCMAHGAGDLFCSIFVGCLAHSFKFERSVRLGQEFTFKFIQNLNEQGKDTTLGINFEQNLAEICAQIKAKT